jgi:hypothetical protein
LRNRGLTRYIGMAWLPALLPAGTAAAGRAAGAAALTRQGPVRGVREKGVYVYKGIPSAKVPVGELRFVPPQGPSRGRKRRASRRRIRAGRDMKGQGKGRYFLTRRYGRCGCRMRGILILWPWFCTEGNER